jgi:predicted transcriptional regulator
MSVYIRGFRKVPPGLNKHKRHKIKSLGELADIVGVNRSYFTKVYAGLCCPSLPVVIRTARALGISMDTLVKTFPDNVKNKPINHKSGKKGKIYVYSDDEYDGE